MWRNCFYFRDIFNVSEACTKVNHTFHSDTLLCLNLIYVELGPLIPPSSDTVSLNMGHLSVLRWMDGWMVEGRVALAGMKLMGLS